ncbi:MAG: FtsX-like permease family protein [Lachnospiraceae bacterium]|nr:FtsX-like permease family protein [Lachnospiraceae bacterium]
MREKRGNIYSRLAFTGIVKNYRTYVPYLLTCIGMVMMCYILHFLMESEQVAAMEGGDTLQAMLSFGNGVFAVFAVIFLFYTNSFLIRNRKKEFGLYNILGMGKRNLARILLWENGIIAVLSLVGGMLCGILFSKLAELFIAIILHAEISMKFSVELQSMTGTLRLFLVIFLLILMNALFQVGKAKPIDLLHSSAVGEKPPKANWLLAIAGFGLLGAAYYIAASIQDPMSAFMLFFVAVAMVIVATYLIFIAGSVVLCKVLQKNKKYYYRPNHFVSVSSMMYRMKRNGAGLASICVLSTMVLVMLSAATCLYFGNEARLTGRYPRQIELSTYSFDKSYLQQIDEAVDTVLESSGLERENVLEYRYLSIGGYFDNDQVILDEEKLVKDFSIMDAAKVQDIYFIPVDDYNRIMGAEEALGENEVLLYAPRTGSYEYDTITLEGCETWKIKKRVDDFVETGEATATIFNSIYLFVPDEAFLEQVYTVQKEIYGRNASSLVRYYGFDIPAGDETQMQAAEKISHAVDELMTADESFPFTLRSCRAAEKADFLALYGGLFVLGVLLAAVFLAATVLIMYYKQITEGLEDQSRFDIMQKVGMTDREIRSSIHSQMLTVFLLPLLLAGLHTVFAFPIVRKLLMLFGIMNSRVLLFTNIGCFLVFTLFYTAVYFITSRSYYKIVRGARK